MKMKYTAAAALLAWLLVVGWLASMVIAKPAVMRTGNQSEETAATAELRNGIARNRRVAAAIAELHSNTPILIADGASVVALPTAAPVASNNNGNGSTGADGSEGTTTHVISLVLAARDHRMAIIDGRKVRVGSRLDDGSRGAAISADGVRLADPSGKQDTYPVRNPLQPEQAGGQP